MSSRALVTIALAIFGLALAGVAAADSGMYSPTRPVTVQMSGHQCSTTEFGPTFYYNPSGWEMVYGGGTSCAQGTGTKWLTVSAQVLGQDGRTWFTISGSTFVGGPTVANPLRVTTQRQVFLGHAYRIVARGSAYHNGKPMSAVAIGQGWAP